MSGLANRYIEVTLELKACTGAIAGIAHICRSEVWTADEKVARILRDVDAYFAKYPTWVEAPDAD